MGAFRGRVSSEGESISVHIRACLAVVIYPDLVGVSDVCDGVGDAVAGGEFGWAWEVNDQYDTTIGVFGEGVIVDQVGVSL